MTATALLGLALYGTAAALALAVGVRWARQSLHGDRKALHGARKALRGPEGGAA